MVLFCPASVPEKTYCVVCAWREEVLSKFRLTSELSPLLVSGEKRVGERDNLKIAVI